MTPNEIQAKLRDGDALLLVDVQIDFCPGGRLPVEGGDQITGEANRWVSAAERRGLPIYVSRDWHPEHHISFRHQGGPWPIHCVQDSPGAAFHPALELPDGVIKISKGVRLDRDQLSAFDETGLADDLRRRGVERIWVGGLAQDVCVRATVLDGLRNNFETVVILEATRPISPDNGARAIEEMLARGAQVERAAE